MDKTRRTFLLTVMVGIGFLSISFTTPLHAAGEDDLKDKDHDTSTETASDAARSAEIIRTGGTDDSARKTDGQAKPKADAKKLVDEKRKLSQERIRTELNDLNDPGLLKLWSSLTDLTDLDLAKFKELVLAMPATDNDKKKDEDKKEKLVKLFEKESEALGSSPLKDFQRVAAEIVNDRFRKITEKPKVTEVGQPPAAGVDKAKADADKKAVDAAAKLADEAKKGLDDSKKAADAKQADELAKLGALDPKAGERKALGDALKNALGQGQGGEGQGGGGSPSGGSPDAGGGSPKGDESGSGDTGKKDLAKTDTGKKDKTPKKDSSSTNNNSSASAEATPKATPKEEKKTEPLFADSKPEPKKTPTPEAEASPSTPPTAPQVAEAGFKPSGPGSSRKPGSLGQGSGGKVIEGGRLAGGPEGGPGGREEGAGKVQNPSNANNGGGLDPGYLNSIKGAVPREMGPTTTGYNMIKTGPGEWQSSDGGGSAEVYGLEGNNDDEGGSKRKVSYASSTPVGFPSNDGGARAPSSAGRGATMEADGVFKKRNEWAGGAGLCLGGMKNLIGPCGKLTSPKSGEQHI